MKKIKDTILGSLGIVGFILWYIISSVILFAPLVFLDVSFFTCVLIILAIQIIPFVGSIIEFIIWVWAFIVVVSEPIDGWSIAYFVLFAIYVFTKVLPFVLNAITVLLNSASNNER